MVKLAPVDITSPGLCLELRDDIPYVRCPYLWLGCDAATILIMNQKWSTSSAEKSLPPFKLKGNVMRLLQRVENVDYENDIVFRWLQNTQILIDNDGGGKNLKIDEDRPQGADLFSPSLLLKLFHQKVQGFNRDRNQSKMPTMAFLLGNQLHKLTCLLPDAKQKAGFYTQHIPFRGPVPVAALKQKVQEGFFKRSVLTDFPQGLKDGDFWRAFLLHTTGSCQNLPDVMAFIWKGSLKQSWPVDCSYELTAITPAGNAASQSATKDGANRVVQPAHAGRPKESFASKVCRLQDPMTSTANAHSARVNLIHGHILTLLAIKLSTAGDTHPIGLSTDDVPIAGKKWSQVKTRGRLVCPPLSTDNETPMSIPHPPYHMYSYTTNELKALIQKSSRLQVGEDLKDEFIAAAAQDVLLRHVSDMISVKQLGTERLVCVTIDKGPAQRMFWLFLQAEGYNVIVFWDGPHVMTAKMLSLAKFGLPESLPRLMKARSTAGGSQSYKLANVMTAMAQLDNASAIEAIGDHRDQLQAELGLKSFEIDDLAREFRAKSRELAGKLATINNKKLGKYAYFCALLWDFFTTYKLSVKVIYEKEHGTSVPILQARVKQAGEKIGETAYTRLMYNADDLEALQEVINSRALEEKGKLVDEVFSDDDDQDNELKPMKKQPEKAAAAAAVVEDQEDDLLADEAGDKDGKDGKKNKKKKDAGELNSKKEKSKTEVTLESVHVEPNSDNLISVMWKFFNNPDSRMKIFVHYHVVRPVLFAHALQIGLEHTNILARGMQWHLPVVMMCEIGTNVRNPMPMQMREFVDTHPSFPSEYGQQVIHMLKGAFELAVAQLSQHQRVLLYGTNDKLDFAVDETLKEISKMHESLRWILKAPESFVCSPDLFGIRSGGFRSVYETDINAENKWSQMSELRFPEKATSFGLHDRTDAADFEKDVYIAQSTLATSAAEGYIPAMRINAVLDNQINYRPLSEMMLDLEFDNREQFVQQAAAIQEARALSTRDIEAQGAVLSRASTKANASGVLVDNLPLYLCQGEVPDFIPWLNPLQPLDTDKIDVNWQDIDGNSHKPKKRFATKGVELSFSELDGRHTVENDGDQRRKEFWNFRTMEQVMPWCLPNHVNRWYTDYIEGHTKEHGDDANLLLEAQQQVYGKFIAAHEGQKFPYVDSFLKKAIRDVLTLEKTKTILSHEDHEKMTDYTFNIENIHLMPIAELIAYENKEMFESQNEEFAHRVEVGRDFCILLEGIVEKCHADGRPCVLRIVPREREAYSARYFVVTSVECRINTVLLFEMEAVNFADHAHHEDGTEIKGWETREVEIKETKLLPEDGEEEKKRRSNPSLLLDRMAHSCSSPRVHLENHRTTIEAVQQEDKYAEVKDMYFSFPKDVENYRFPTQNYAGANKKSHWKPLFLQSEYLAYFSSEAIYSLRVATTARWVTNAKEYLTIHVHLPFGDPEMLPTPLEAAQRVGFGLTDSWASGKKSSLKADLKRMVCHLFKENPELVALLRELGEAAPQPTLVERLKKKLGKEEKGADMGLVPNLEQQEDVDIFGYPWSKSKFQEEVMVDIEDRAWGSHPEHYCVTSGVLLDPRVEMLEHRWRARTADEDPLKQQKRFQEKLDEQEAAEQEAVPMEIVQSQEPPPDNMEDPFPPAELDAEPDAVPEQVPMEEEEVALQKAEEAEAGLYMIDDDGKKRVSNVACAAELDSLSMDMDQWCEVFAVVSQGSICAGVEYLHKRGFYSGTEKKGKKDSELGEQIASAHTTCTALFFTLQKTAVDRALGKLAPKAAKAFGAKKGDGPKLPKMFKAPAAEVHKSRKAVADDTKKGDRLIRLVKAGTNEPKPLTEEYLANKLLEEEDPHEGDAHRDHYVQLDIEKAVEEEAKLKKKYVQDEAVEKDKRLYEKCQSNFVIQGVDLTKMQARIGAKKYTLYCNDCEEPIVKMQMNFIGANAPNAKCMKPSDPKVYFTRQNGAGSHLPFIPVDPEVPPRCYCGYHANGQIYEDVECTIPVKDGGLWRCVGVFANYKARQLNYGCECGLDFDVKDLLTLKPSETFGKRSKLYKRKNEKNAETVDEPAGKKQKK